jgi:exosortase/archaeosortase family protein
MSEGASNPRRAATSAPRPLRLLRPVAALALLAGAAWLVFDLDITRTWEAATSAWVLDTVFGQSAHWMTGRPLIAVMSATPFILRVSVECTIALAIAPFLVVCAGLIASPRFNPVRVGVSGILGIAAMYTANQFRIAGIGWSMVEWGAGGYGWSHTVVGSMLTLVAFAIALLVLWFGAIRRSNRSLAKVI